MGMAALTVPTLGWGLEGGVFDDPETQTMWITVWVCVYDGEQAYTVNGCRFEIPNDIAAHVREGMELGDAVDTVIRQEGTKYSRGIIGVLTNDFLDRADAYGHLALLALGLWVGRKWRAAARRALQ
jgi:non-canonical (house-cleaning) NTP pyrophosphatase